MLNLCILCILCTICIYASYANYALYEHIYIFTFARFKKDGVVKEIYIFSTGFLHLIDKLFWNLPFTSAKQARVAGTACERPQWRHQPCSGGGAIDGGRRGCMLHYWRRLIHCRSAAAAASRGHDRQRSNQFAAVPQDSTRGLGRQGLRSRVPCSGCPGAARAGSHVLDPEDQIQWSWFCAQCMQISCQIQAIYAVFLQKMCSLETRYSKNMHNMQNIFTISTENAEYAKNMLNMRKTCNKYAAKTQSLKKMQKNKKYMQNMQQ